MNTRCHLHPVSGTDLFKNNEPRPGTLLALAGKLCTGLFAHDLAFAAATADAPLETVFDLFEEEVGLDALFGLIKEALPEKLYETAYALACDVAAADGKLPEVQLRFLEEIRHELNIDRLHGAAIERGARARHMLIE